MKNAEALSLLEKHYAKQINCNKDLTTQNWLRMKHRHSIIVYNTMKKMLEDENFLGISEELRENMLSSAILHDLGRFYQMKDGELDRSIEHGKKGADILSDCDGIAEPTLLLPIKYHENPKLDAIFGDTSFTSLSKKKQDDVILSLKVLKDADILGNAKMQIDDNDIYTPSLNFTPEIADEMFNAVLDGRLYNGTHHMKTVFDSVASRLCFLYGLNLDASKKVYTRLGANEFFFNYFNRLKEISINHGFVDQNYLDEQIEKIKSVLTKRNELSI